MTTTTQTPRSTRSASQWKPEIRTKGSGLPSRLIVHAVEGFGKTSFAAQAPSPIVLMARGETGLETLIDSGQLGETPHFPELQTWHELMSAIEWLTTTDHEHKTVVLDTINGFERLCHESVCDRDFNGNWTDKGFMGYMRGYETSLADWRLFLNALDRLRMAKKMAIICLCHTKVNTFKNPEGPDYDRYQPDMHHKTWGLTHKWADHVLFGNFYTEVVEDKNRGKGKDGQTRLLYTVRHAAYDAKNRASLPEEIDCGKSAAEAWANFRAALKGGAK